MMELLATSENGTRSAAAGDARIRVLHVISGRMFGGGQVGVLELVRALPAVAPVDARVCLLGKETTHFDEVGPAVVDYDGRYRRPWVLYPCAKRLRRAIEDVAPDILHTHGYDAELIGALAVSRLPVRHVSHIRDTPGWIPSRRLKHRLRRALTRAVLARAGTEFIAVSEAAKRYVCEHMGWPLSRVRVVLNGIDAARFCRCESPLPPNGSGPTILGTAARLAPVKGLDVLLQAMAVLRGQDIPVHLRIAGDGSLRERLGRMAIDLGLSACVEFLGLVQDMPRFYQELDVFVLPSLSEAMPRGVLEAMASARPVVATAVMGTPEAVRDGQDGFLVPAGDPNALAAAVARLARDPQLRHSLGQSGRDRALSCFTVDHVCRGIAEIYEGLLPGRPQRPPARAVRFHHRTPRLWHNWGLW